MEIEEFAASDALMTLFYSWIFEVLSLDVEIPPESGIYIYFTAREWSGMAR